MSKSYFAVSHAGSATSIFITILLHFKTSEKIGRKSSKISCWPRTDQGFELKTLIRMPAMPFSRCEILSLFKLKVIYSSYDQNLIDKMAFYSLTIHLLELNTLCNLYM